MLIKRTKRIRQYLLFMDAFAKKSAKKSALKQTLYWLNTISIYLQILNNVQFDYKKYSIRKRIHSTYSKHLRLPTANNCILFWSLPLNN